MDLQQIAESMTIKGNQEPFAKSPYWLDFKVLFNMTLNATKILDVVRCGVLALILIGDQLNSDSYAKRKRQK